MRRIGEFRKLYSTRSSFLYCVAVGLTAFSVVSITGCVNSGRSRDLGNPDIDPAVTAVQVCSACHGADGNSKSPNFPRLAGQRAEYIESQLTKFRAHQRIDPEGYEYMWGISHKLTDGQIAGLSAYFSKQVPQSNPVPDRIPTDAGKAIFENGIPEKQVTACQACHGAKAEGLGAFPRLAGQHRDYLMKQLLVFRDTEGRPGTPMKEVTHNLDRNEVDAVTIYIQGMPVN